MLFNSYIFVLLFLPLTLMGYFGLNRLSIYLDSKYIMGKLYLLGMSLWFYAYFNVSYLPIIIGSVFVNYLINRILVKQEKRLTRRIWLFVALVLNLSVLFYFKYNDFFWANVNQIFQTSFTLRNIVLPLGISFFTFQQISYILDSYAGEVPEYGFVDYALFVTYFPQLIAGPIVTHEEIVPQFESIEKKVFQFENFSKGIYAFAIGLVKKVIIADTFGIAVGWGYENVSSLDTTNAILVMLFYTMQIYFDFSGYCDMAVGIGKMFNIDITMNFNSPYKAFTIIEFWKRWHITLTRFFTKYVYIPLGGNRKGKMRSYVNTIIVFCLSGFWHGANWTFVLWGLMHGVFLVITKIFKKTFDKLHPAFNWMLTFAFINVSWIYFRADSIGQANHIVKAIGKMEFGSIKTELITPFVLREVTVIAAQIPGTAFTENKTNFILLFFGFAFLIVLNMKNTLEKISIFRPTVLNMITTAIFLFWGIVSFAGISEFLYFNF